MVSFLRDGEKILATSLIIVFFLLNLSIASRSPNGAWMDEVCYVDPGLNLAVGKGWVSSSYPWQTDHEFVAGTSPLFPGALALWAKIFGVSMVSARAYCYFVAAVAMFFLWLGTLRLNLLTPAYRLLWIVILSTEYGMNWMARDDRYDVWIFFGLAMALFGASLPGPGAKHAVIFLGCFLIPFAGFIGVTYVFLVAVLIAAISRLKFWKESFFALAGAGSGVVGVGIFFAAFGSLEAFRMCVHERTVADQIKDHPIYKIFIYPVDDFGVIVMIGLLSILSLYTWRFSLRRALPWLALGWGMVVFMPCIMIARGVFNMMYFYMLIIPLSLAILQVTLQVFGQASGRYLAMVLTVMMGMLSLGGLPARLYTSLKEWEFRDPQHMRVFVRTYIHPDDIVYSDDHFYYELRDYVKFLATPFYRKPMPADEAARINVALVPDNEFPDLTKDAAGLGKIGDGWKKVAVFPDPETLKLQRTANHETYTLYRRDVPSP